MQGSAIVRHVVTFGHVLREAGIEVGPGRVLDALRSLDAVDLTRQEDVYFALRQTLVSRHDELGLLDRAFAAWFLRGPVAPLVRQKDQRLQVDRLVQGSLTSGRRHRRARSWRCPVEAQPSEQQRSAKDGQDTPRSWSAATFMAATAHEAAPCVPPSCS